MLLFITSLKHPKTANSWPNLSRVFERTLKSVCEQIHPEFEVLVVCNKTPDIQFEHPCVEYLEVDFPSPAPNPQSLRKNTEAIRWDRGRKYLHALYRGRDIQPSHVMFFDSDDCVSKRLSKLSAMNPDCAGWKFTKGYAYRNGRKSVVRIGRGFYRMCGTSHIVKFDALDHHLKEGEISKKFIMEVLGSHLNFESIYAPPRLALSELPFEGAVYVIGTDENWSGKLGYTNIIWRLWKSGDLSTMGLFRIIRKLSHSFCDEYGIYEV